MKQRGKPPKGTQALSNTEEAGALHVYILNDADIEATHKALPDIPMRTLLWYEENTGWQLRYHEHRNQLLEKAVYDAGEKKRLQLKILHNVRGAAYDAVMGVFEADGETYKRMPIQFKTAERAVECLVELIRLEREILPTGAAPGDATKQTSMMEVIMTAVKKGGEVSLHASGNDKAKTEISQASDRDDDPFHIRRDLKGSAKDVGSDGD